MTSQFWSEEKEDILAAMWEERTFLYDNNLKGFNNRAKKDQASREIAYALGIPVGFVMKRMVSMRTQYSRLKNKGLKDGKPPSRKARWLLDHLHFLAPYIDCRNTGNAEAEGVEEEDVDQVNIVYTDGDFEPAVLPPRVQFKKRDYNIRKRKLVEYEEDEEEEDPIEQDDYSEDLVDYSEHNGKGLERVDLIECSAPRIKAQSMSVPNVPNQLPSQLPAQLPSPVSMRDQEQLFCDFIAGELRDIHDPIAKSKLMNKIQNDVFNIKIGEAYKGSLEAGGVSGVPVPYKLEQNMHCSNSAVLGSPSPPPHISNIVSVSESSPYKLSPTNSHNTY